MLLGLLNRNLIRAQRCFKFLVARPSQKIAINQVSPRNQSKTRPILLLGVAGLSLTVLNSFLSLHNKPLLASKNEADAINEEQDELEDTISIDLNEVYEKCAVVFLSNGEV